MEYEEPNMWIVMFDNKTIDTLGNSDDEMEFDWEVIPNANQL